MRESGVDVIGFLDAAAQSKLFEGLSGLGKTDSLPVMKEKYGVDAVYCPLGNNRLGVKFQQTARELGYVTLELHSPRRPNISRGENFC